MSETTDPDRPAPRGRSVLVADGNTDAAETLAAILRLRGHQVMTALSGPDALAAAEAHRPDAVFLSIHLPGLGGYEVARKLRAAAADGRTLLLVAMTGYATDDDRRKSREAGFDHHLVKPTDPSEILALLGPGPATPA